MELNQVTLPSTDVERSAKFYRTMGFGQIVESLPMYARFECLGRATFSVHRVAPVSSESNVIIYFECADVDATCATLTARGITIDSPPKDQEWLWREARLRDPDGNVLCLYHAGEIRRYPPWRLSAATIP